MASHAPRGHHRYTYAEYLDLEEASNSKHEFLDGEIYAMAGGTPEHAALAAALTIAVGSSLRGGPCRAYSSDLRVRVLATGLATYPDLTVICGPLETDPDSRVTAVNPTLLAEVLSDSTEDYDRGEKLDHYRQIPSLQECLLISHREKSIERWRRSGGSWERTVAGAGDLLELRSIGCTLRVSDVYGTA
jgi:Uma2 family endonuclease